MPTCVSCGEKPAVYECQSCGNFFCLSCKQTKTKSKWFCPLCGSVYSTKVDKCTRGPHCPKCGTILEKGWNWAGLGDRLNCASCGIGYRINAWDTNIPEPAYPQLKEEKEKLECCPVCGSSKFKAISATSKTSEVCPSCNAMMPDNALFCGRCGTKLQKQKRR